MLRASGYNADTPLYAEHLGETSADVRKRVCALKKLQVDAMKVEADFYERVHELEKEFQPRFDAVQAKRKEIVNGAVEPTAADSDIPLLHAIGKEELEKLESEWNAKNTGSSKGVPDFWLNVLRSASGICEMIQEHDAPILKHLVDITCTINDEPKSYTLYYHFSENEYFTNSVLTKFYEISTGIDEKSPFDYEGPVVISVKGTEINWKDGKNITKKVIKKKLKKGTGAGKFVTKSVKTDSFFNFFDPTVTSIHDGEDEESQDLMRADFELGQLFRDQIIPRAVLYYTGEAIDDDQFDDFDEEDMDDMVLAGHDEE
ncbi:hypothetical protein L596_004472 [Steinernema carpocapsae]|uniref:Nucleosome assembly protein n=1 Tax=Steinernema carpocapsae TaxID=34508 RepID=A0A4U8UXJ0_STECR|nr:hypothetical protein L596_004472 [Steinernema carpocapsae]